MSGSSSLRLPLPVWWLVFCFQCQCLRFQQRVFERALVLVVLPPVRAEKTQCLGGPDIIIPPKRLLHESKSELFVFLPHCCIHAVPFQIPIQKPTENSRFLHRIKHYDTPFTQTGIIVAWRVGFEKRRFSQDSIAKFDTSTYSILRPVVY